MGPFDDPKLLQLVNDGPLVAFNARDFAHQVDLWLGDLRDGSIKIVYKAAETPGFKVDIWYPQLNGGRLLWIEYVHDGEDVYSYTKEWTVRVMDIATGSVSIVADGAMPRYGGKMYVERIRFDGKRIVVAEALADGRWQLQIWDLSGRVLETIPVARVLYEFAPVSDGVLYTTGIDDPSSDSIGHMRFYHWTEAGGSQEVGVDAFQVNAEGDLAAWVVDPEASQLSTGNPQAQRLFTALNPFASPSPVSPVVNGNPTMGLAGMDCGSGMVAWWEIENDQRGGRDVLTLWQPGWAAPVQVITDGGEDDHISVQGGWLVWLELYGREYLPERIHGVPLSLLVAQPSA